MADQVFNVNCGFFNAINNDRTYSADQMNLPYKRLVSNGVFANNEGNPSDDFQVSSAGSGMDIVVKSGEGIFANKWFNNPQAITITVPDNTSLNPRIDSVIIQVDNRSEGRAGNIVYRTGTPASSPVAPEINTTSGVTEYRVANIAVSSYATSIGNEVITDLRGSASCPWITSLIQQVDTTALWQQFQAAYANQYAAYDYEYQQYTAEQRQAWEDFLSTLTSELSVSTNIIILTSSYSTLGSTTNVPINIVGYDSDTDVLLVFINGLLAVGKYTLNANKTSIDLNNALPAGNNVYFVVLHSVVAADIESTVSMIQTLNDRLSNYMSDSGWVDLTLESGITAADSTSTPGVRSIGGRIYIRGAVKGISAAGTTICALPVDCRPEMDHIFFSAATQSAGVLNTVVINVQSDGFIKIKANSGTISAQSMISLNTNFLSAIPVLTVPSE